MNALIEAVINGDFQRVQIELNKQWYGVIGENGMTGLHYAALLGLPEIGQLFIDRGLFVNRTTFDGKQPLHIAAMAHQDNMVDMLMENGAAILAVDFDGNTPLHYAIMNNPPAEFIQKLIDLGSNVHSENNNGQSPIDWVMHEGNSAVLVVFLQNDVVPNNLNPLLQSVVDGDFDAVLTNLNTIWYGAVDSLGMTGLHYATVLGHPDIAQLFLDAGVFVNRTTYDGRQPLHLAAMAEQSEMVDKLMENGAAIQAVDFLGNTPLHYAVKNNASVEFVQKLLDFGANINAENNDGQTPLSYVDDGSNEALFLHLLSEGAESSSLNQLLIQTILGNTEGVVAELQNSWFGATGPGGWTGLHYAAHYGHPDVVELFVDAGLFVNRTNYTGEQPLHIAAMRNNGDVVDALIDNGAAIGAVDFKGNTPLHYAVINNTDLDFVQKLIDHGANVNSVNNSGNAPLDLVDLGDNPELYALLLSNGAENDSLSEFIVASILGDADKVATELQNVPAATLGEDGNTGLHYAALFGHPDVAQLIIDAGVFVNRTNYDGLQPLHIAAQAHQAEMVDLLMDNGAAIRAVDFDGYTPLHYAVMGNPPLDLVQRLIDLGSDVNAENNVGLTPLKVAEAEGNTDVIDVLLDNGALNLLTVGGIVANDGTFNIVVDGNTGQPGTPDDPQVNPIIDVGDILDLVPEPVPGMMQPESNLATFDHLDFSAISPASEPPPTHVLPELTMLPDQ